MCESAVAACDKKSNKIFAAQLEKELWTSEKELEEPMKYRDPLRTSFLYNVRIQLKNY